MTAKEARELTDKIIKENKEYQYYIIDELIKKSCERQNNSLTYLWPNIISI
jgi:hypothetical protein